MGFLRRNDLQLAQNGEFVLDFGVLLKIVTIGGLQAENKIRKKM